jgi:hypothetical protein
MKKDKYRYDHLWIWVVFILALGVLLLVGCASSKVKSSYQATLDSSHLKAERSDSAGVKESTQVKKSDSQEDNTIVIDFGDTGIYRPHPDSGFQDRGIYVSPSEYFSLSSTGEIRASKVPQRVIIKNLRQASNSDSIALKDMANENHSKIEVSEVQKQEKKTEKAKYAFNLLWLLWLLVIPVGAWIYKNRWKIYQRLKMIVVKLFTGL